MTRSRTAAVAFVSGRFGGSAGPGRVLGDHPDGGAIAVNAWAIFAGFAFYMWYRLARDAWEKEVEALEELGGSLREAQEKLRALADTR